MNDDVAEILELERRRCEAIGAGEGDALRRLLSDDYIHCHGTGLVQGREELVRHVLANPRQIEPRSPDVRIYGASAVLTGALVNIISVAGVHKPSPPIFATQVAVRSDGVWRFVSFQATPMSA